MTYNVFSGTLNPTHFTSLHCFRLEMISWRRELKDLARLCRQLQLLLLVGRCVFLYVARPAGAMSMHVTFNPQLGWDAVPWAYFLVNFYKGGAGLSYLNTLSENCLFIDPLQWPKLNFWICQMTIFIDYVAKSSVFLIIIILCRCTTHFLMWIVEQLVIWLLVITTEKK